MAKVIAENLQKSYKGRTVVNDVNFYVEQGEVVGLLGPNGAGKTTTFYMVIGLITPEQGNIFLENENITQYPMYIRARKGISYLPQEPSAFRKLTVQENIMEFLSSMNFKLQSLANNHAWDLGDCGSQQPLQPLKSMVSFMLALGIIWTQRRKLQSWKSKE